MNNLKTFEKFKYQNDEKTNEGFLFRTLLRCIMGLSTTIKNIRELFTDKNYMPYKLSIMIPNIYDFLKPLAKNIDLLEYYDGNYFDLYQKKYKKNILDDIAYIKNYVDESITKIYKKGNKGNSDIDPYGEEIWNNELSDKDKMKVAKLKYLFENMTELGNLIEDYNKKK